MRSTILTRIVNSAIWIVSGVVVIIVRASVTQGGSVLVWTTIGGGMIVYGAANIVLGGGPICPGIGWGPMGICSGIEKKATIWRISATKTMIRPMPMILRAAPMR